MVCRFIGYGGGYMDRQNVEYIEREDDEEFDEFGRKKKRRKIDNKAEEVSIIHRQTTWMCWEIYSGPQLRLATMVQKTEQRNVLLKL